MTAETLEKPGSPHSELKGWHVFWMMAAFFGFMLVVNGIFLYAAVTTHPGEQTENAYMVGVDYNRTLDARAVQAKAGWGAAIGLGDGDTSNVIIVQLFDREGAPLYAERATVTGIRKGDTGAPQVIALAGSGPGRFEADLQGWAAGVWKLTFEAEIPSSGKPAHFTAEKSVILP